MCQGWRCLSSDLADLRRQAGMLFPGCSPGVNCVALFTPDTLHPAVQPAGETKAAEMVHDAA